jgi:hypothetical protein
MPASPPTRRGLHRAGGRLPAGAVRSATAVPWPRPMPAGAAWPPACWSHACRRLCEGGRLRAGARAGLAGPVHRAASRFEVGADVLQAFGADPRSGSGSCAAAVPMVSRAGWPTWPAWRAAPAAAGVQAHQRRPLVHGAGRVTPSSRSAATRGSPGAWPLTIWRRELRLARPAARARLRAGVPRMYSTRTAAAPRTSRKVMTAPSTVPWLDRASARPSSTPRRSRRWRSGACRSRNMAVAHGTISHQGKPRAYAACASRRRASRRVRPVQGDIDMRPR